MLACLLFLGQYSTSPKNALRSIPVEVVAIARVLPLAARPIATHAPRQPLSKGGRQRVAIADPAFRNKPEQEGAQKTITEMIHEDHLDQRFSPSTTIAPGFRLRERLDGMRHTRGDRPGDIAGVNRVDLPALLQDDARIINGQVRASSGLIAPYLGAFKKAVETKLTFGWSEIRGLPSAPRVDPTCAKRKVQRYEIGTYRLLQDAAGDIIQLQSLSTVRRPLDERIRRAITAVSLAPLPPELQNRDHSLETWWNVFVDDFSFCGFFGQRANGEIVIPALPYLSVVVELETSL